MTKEKQCTIIKLRDSGLTLKAIAMETGMPFNTVKSFFQRYAKKVSQQPVGDGCRNCGGVLRHTPGRRKKIYCCNSCRIQWWNKHMNPENRTKLVQITCERCGKTFMDYLSKNRKYCSNECYIAARFHHE